MFSNCHWSSRLRQPSCLASSSKERGMIYPDSKVLLDVRDLHATVNDIEILKGIDLTVRAGEVHAIMGTNGSGKSTFAKVLAGHSAYRVTGGSVSFEGRDLFDLQPEERARPAVSGVPISD